MISRLTMDKAGRVVLPKPVRDELQLSPGDPLELDSTEERIVLRPLRGTMPLRKKRGIWVFRAGEPLPVAAVNEILKHVRHERDRDNLGQYDFGRSKSGPRKSHHHKAGKAR